MGYRIVELNEKELPYFKGKILQVLDSRKGSVEIGRDYLGCSITKYMWVLVCLVEGD